MPKPSKRDTPDTQSRENAIRSRTIEGPDSGAVSTANRRDQTQEHETRTDERPAKPGDSDHAEPQAMGDVPAPAASPDPAIPEDAPCAREDGETVRRRFITEGRWRDISPVRDRMMVEAKKAIPDKEARRAWVYAELDRMYPPVQEKPAETDMGFVGIKGLTATKPIYIGNSDPDGGQIQGLSDLPKDWPELPANASLGADVGWVQANRLRIVEERLGQATRVRLDQAIGPAPSWAALGWLETSIRSYAKFVDVAAKVSGGADDEGAVLRRERKSVDEVRALLAEMEEAEGTCPSCGRPFAGN